MATASGFPQFSSKLSKLAGGLGTKFMKELREFDSLIKAIGECKSKSEEDRIIMAETELLKQRLSDPKVDKSRGREYLFIDQNHELVLLLVNTLLSDLKSDNFLNVSTALVVTTKLIGADLINAVFPMVVERLKHPKETVRKKAIMALHRFQQLDPRHEGALAGLDTDKHLRTCLCDKDPGVMSAALCALHDAVSEHRLPKAYDYHRFPAPFIQVMVWVLGEYGTLAAAGGRQGPTAQQ
ncbi:adaptin_N domain-containing protein, partial [Haematococcus lacustris]